jgi:two-component system, NarL family, sensor kinase
MAPGSNGNVAKTNPHRNGFRDERSASLPSVLPSETLREILSYAPNTLAVAIPCTAEELVKALHEFVLIIDSDGVIESLWSSKLANDPEEARYWLGKRIRDLVDCETVERWQAAADGLQNSADGFEHNVQLPGCGGHFLLRVTRLARAGANSAGLCLVSHKRQYGLDCIAELQRNGAWLEQAEALANMGSWEFDVAMGKPRWSQNLRKILGVPKDCDDLEAHIWSITHPDDHEMVRKAIGGAMQDGQAYEFQMRCTLPDGRERILLNRGRPVKDQHNRVVKRIGVTIDVTERVQAAQALRESESRYRDLVEHSHEMICTHDLEGRLLSMNEHSAKMLRCELGDVVGRSLSDFLVGKSREGFASYIEQIRRDGYAEGLMKVTTQTGEHRIWSFRSMLRTVGLPAPIVRGMAHDVTELKQMEAMLRKSESLLAQAEEIAKLGSWEHDLRTGKAAPSRHLLKMQGLPADLQWTPEIYRSRLHPKDRARVQELLKQSQLDGKPFEYAARYMRPDGGIRVFWVRSTPVVGASGEVERGIGVMQDITEQARAEETLRQLSQELMNVRDRDRRQSARELHETVGQSLAALKMTLGNLREALSEENELAREFLASAAELAELSIREVRTVSYLMHPPMLDEAGLGPALRWYARGFAERSGIKTTIDVAENFERQSQDIETTVFRIVQEALTNVHRYSGSRTASIRVARENGHIRAEVRDEGCGLALARPLGGRQTPLGVGIAGMRERVKQLNGSFELESTPGVGTTVRAILPIAPAATKAPGSRGWRGGENAEDLEK